MTLEELKIKLDEKTSKIKEEKWKQFMGEEGVRNALVEFPPSTRELVVRMLQLTFNMSFDFGEIAGLQQVLAIARLANEHHEAGCFSKEES